MLPEVKLASYRKSDWEKLMKSIVDRDSIHDTWEEWNQEYNRAKNQFMIQGFAVHSITIDIDALNQYCRELGLPNNGRTRSQYTASLPLPGKKNK